MAYGFLYIDYKMGKKTITKLEKSVINLKSQCLWALTSQYFLHFIMVKNMWTPLFYSIVPYKLQLHNITITPNIFIITKNNKTN